MLLTSPDGGIWPSAVAVVIHGCFFRKVQAESQAVVVVSLPVACDWSLLKGDIMGRHIFHIGDVQQNSINKFIYQ